jgi:hypothetical protein
VKKQIPIPRTGGGRPPKYPWNSLKNINDSFQIPIDSKGPYRTQGNVLSAANRRGIKVTSRILGDIVRVWRVA